MTGWTGEVRPATWRRSPAWPPSSPSRSRSRRTSYPPLLADPGARLLLAADGQEVIGCLLGFRHLTFYANGPVAWVEEVVVRPGDRGGGVGGALMSAFEEWAAGHGCALVALATRRAAPFYLAVGYEESAVYFRKVLSGQPRP